MNDLVLQMSMQHHAIFELRRYRVKPGARDTLIRLFDSEFIESQEELGMRIEGQFRDRDDPDAFVWVRSFADMAARTAALQAFYGGPVWAAHGPAANATMLNVDNVLLLKPAGDLPPFAHGRTRGPQERAGAGGVIVVTVCSLARAGEEDFARFVLARAVPAMREAGARMDAIMVTERSPNGFPRLPVREGETMVVWFEGHADEAHLARYRERLHAHPVWADEVMPRLMRSCWRIETAVLSPTSRSLCA